MRVDDIPDGLIRNDLFDRIDHRDGSGLVFRTVDNGDVISELYRDAPCPARQTPHAVRELLGHDRLFRRCRSLLMLAGTSNAAGMFCLTSVMITSSTGYPPLRCTMRAGNFTPLKSL